MAQRKTIATRQFRLAQWARTIERSSLREMLAMTARPDILSFALGLPAPDLFPIRAYAKASAKVLSGDPRALQYEMPLSSMKAHIAGLMAQRGARCGEEQIFLTTGAQQGMSLLARLLIDPGDQVLIEEVVYEGLQLAIKPLSPQVLTVPTDLETGLDVDAVGALLAGGARPSFIYTIPDGHNPLAVTMTLEKRRRLVALAAHYQVPIIEDDAYGLLYYGQSPIPPMRAMDEEWVLYVGSFSKVLAPALRVGWLVVPEFLTHKLAVLKQGSDLDVCSLAQRTVSAYLDTGHLDIHLGVLRAEYELRRDVMLSCMREHFPNEVKWKTPLGGMFVWAELPSFVDTSELLIEAMENERVAFTPGEAFRASDKRYTSHCMRLNFSNLAPRQIEDGIFRLSSVLKAALA